ncbi:hypothetical protein CRG98_045021 [Punica granatum]|uniref:Uncharacterized protein n=1 Tax=Punica granatum TaxID=22663 RepID=A0A2I0HS96_PUNGR|nr:hypothetical protein CRG98_045021 [Punica granatum]
MPGLLTRASLLSYFASSPRLRARSSCDLDGSAHPCECTITIRKYAEPARSCFLQPCRVCSPVRVYFHASQVRRACSVVLLTTRPNMLTRASLQSCYACSPSQLARASFDHARSAHPCEFTFILRKFAEIAGSFFLRPCLVSSSVRVYFHARQVRGAGSLVLLTTLPGRLTFRRACSVVHLATRPNMLTCASLQSCYACSPSQLARASFDHARSSHPCEFTFILRKFAETAGSFFLRPCRVSSPVQAYFHASQVAEPARSCFLRHGPICTPVRVYFHASQVRGDCSVVLLATRHDMHTRASLLSCFASLPSLLARATFDLAGSAHPLLSCFASSPSLLARASNDLAGSANPYEFTFMPRKFAEPARSCFLRPCRVCSPVRVYFHASQVRRATSLVPLATLEVRRAYLVVLLATLPGLLTCGSLLSCFASSRSLLARASFDLAGSPHPCDFTFILPKFVETAGSFFMRPSQVYSPVRVYFHNSQVRGACSLVLLAPLPSLLTRASVTLPGLLTRASLLSCFAIRRACSVVLLATLPSLLTRASVTLPGLLTRATLLSCFVSSPSLLGRASCDLAESAHPCECDLAGSPHPCDFTFMLLRRACSVVLLATLPSLLTRASVTLPGLLTRATLLSCFVSSPSLLGRASCDLAESAHPCECDLAGSPHPCDFTFMLLRRACSVVLLATLPSLLTRASVTLPGLLTRATLLSCFVSSPSLLGRASCDLAESAHPCECDLAGSPHPCDFTFMLLRRACSVVLLATLPSLLTRASVTLPGLLTRATLLSCFVSSPSLLGRASCDLAESAHPCECDLAGSPHPCDFTFMLLRRACSVVLLATLPSLLTRASVTLPGLLTRATLLSCFVSSPSLLGRASCDLAESAHPCECDLAGSPHPCDFTFMLLRRACSVVLLATLPSLLTRASVTLPGLLTRATLLSCFVSSPSLLGRASCDLAESAHPCECDLAGSPHPCDFTFMLLRRACSVVLLATLPSLLTRASVTLPGLLTRATLLSCFVSSPSLLGRASCDLAESAHPCECDLAGSPHPCDFTFMLRSSRLLTRASCDLAGSAHPCDFTFTLRKYAEPARSCFLQPCRVCTPVRVYFYASQVRRASSVMLLATSPNMHTRGIRRAGRLALLATLSCLFTACVFTFMHCKFAEPAGPCFLQPYLVCSLVLVYFHASQVRRAYSVVLLATLPGLLIRVSLLSCLASLPSLLARSSCDLDCLLTHSSLLSRFVSSPSLLACASCDLAGSAHPCEFPFMLRKFAEPAFSFFLRPCRVCSPVRVFFHAS